MFNFSEMNKTIRQAMYEDVSGEAVPEGDLTPEYLKKLLGENPQCELEFEARVYDEVATGIDYRDGGLISQMRDEEGTGYITIDYEDGIYNVDATWNTHSFDVSDGLMESNSLDEVIEFIIDYANRFDNFDLTEIYR